LCVIDCCTYRACLQSEQMPNQPIVAQMAFACVTSDKPLLPQGTPWGVLLSQSLIWIAQKDGREEGLAVMRRIASSSSCDAEEWWSFPTCCANTRVPSIPFDRLAACRPFQRDYPAISEAHVSLGTNFKVDCKAHMSLGTNFKVDRKAHMSLGTDFRVDGNAHVSFQEEL